MRLTPHAGYAALNGIARTHATYAKAAIGSATGSIAMWSILALVAGTLFAIDPSISKAILPGIAILGVTLSILERRAAVRRYEDYTARADKYEQLTERTYRTEQETR